MNSKTENKTEEKTDKKLETYQTLLDVVRQIFASVVWTHKIQEKQADIFAEQYGKLETINIVAAAATSCGIIGSVFADCLCIKIIAAILSFITLSITAYFKSFDLVSRQKQNKDAANQFLVIRNELLQIIADIHMKKKDVDEINENYQKIMEKLNELYVSAPSTSDKAVDRATEALKVNKEYTYSEADIDRFLPPALKGKVKE